MQKRKSIGTSQAGVARRSPMLAFLRRKLARLPRAAGLAVAVAVVAGAAAYGTVRSEQLDEWFAHFRDARDAFANAAGFQIAEVTVAGANQVSRDEILKSAGLSPKRSLLFLDAEGARASLKTNPWVADATILKLYPDHLHITVVERNAFALWQKDGKIVVIAKDGTMVQPFVDERYAKLPLVVGQGADKQASDFLALLDRYPAIRDQVRASILVAERRWNLKLNNGLDIRLPEGSADKALETLVSLDAEKKLLSRDVESVDLRLSDRVTVRLSEQAAQAREAVLKERNKSKAKKKGDDV